MPVPERLALSGAGTRVRGVPTVTETVQISTTTTHGGCHGGRGDERPCRLPRTGRTPCFQRQWPNSAHPSNIRASPAWRSLNQRRTRGRGGADGGTDGGTGGGAEAGARGRPGRGRAVAVSQAGDLLMGARLLPFPERPPRAVRSLSPRCPHTTLSGGVLENSSRRGRQAGDAVRGQGHLPCVSPPESAGGRSGDGDARGQRGPGRARPAEPGRG